MNVQNGAGTTLNGVPGEDWELSADGSPCRQLHIVGQHPQTHVRVVTRTLQVMFFFTAKRLPTW